MLRKVSLLSGIFCLKHQIGVTEGLTSVGDFLFEAPDRCYGRSHFCRGFFVRARNMLDNNIKIYENILECKKVSAIKLVGLQTMGTVKLDIESRPRGDVF